MLNLLETKRRGTGELRDDLRLGSRRQSGRDARQCQEAEERGGVSNALIVGQDRSNGESSIVVVEGNDDLVGRVLLGVLHKVEVGIEDVVCLA